MEISYEFYHPHISIYFLTNCGTCIFCIDWMERRKILGPFLKNFRIKDLSLIAMSLLFYMWACFDDVIKLLIYMLGVWIAGHCICHDNRFYVTVYEQKKGEEDRVSKKIKVSVFILFFAISLIVLCLIHFKYTSLLTTIWNYLLRDTMVKEFIRAPVGISFITFSAISYLVDIYRGDTRGGTQGNLQCSRGICRNRDMAWRRMELSSLGRNQRRNGNCSPVYD